MFKGPLLCILLIVSVMTGVAQNREIEQLLTDVEWSEGVVILANGDELRGSVRYNPQVGVLAFKNPDTGESVTYTANTVSSFELFDSIVNGRRTFISLLSNDKGKSNEKQFFFEILLQLESFAVLSRMDAVKIKEGATPTGASPDGFAAPVLYEFAEQGETIFFADDRGNFSPYMRIVSRTDRRKPRTEVLNVSLIATYTGPYYEAVLDFFYKQKLSFHKKEDLLTLLRHYAALSNQDQ